jgi:hypothetical protein
MSKAVVIIVAGAAVVLGGEAIWLSTHLRPTPRSAPDTASAISAGGFSTKNFHERPSFIARTEAPSAAPAGAAGESAPAAPPSPAATNGQGGGSGEVRMAATAAAATVEESSSDRKAESAAAAPDPTGEHRRLSGPHLAGNLPPAGAAAGSQSPPPQASNGPSCGGKVCRADQFCCGPPECGHCAAVLSGRRCPATCPGADSLMAPVVR